MTTPDPVYGDPTAPCWDVVMAVDEFAHERPLSWSPRRIRARQVEQRSRQWRRERRERDAAAR